MNLVLIMLGLFGLIIVGATIAYVVGKRRARESRMAKAELNRLTYEEKKALSLTLHEIVMEKKLNPVIESLEKI